MDLEAMKLRRRFTPGYGALDIEREIEVMRETTKKICASKESARAFLVKCGFMTEDGELAERYK